MFTNVKEVSGFFNYLYFR